MSMNETCMLIGCNPGPWHEVGTYKNLHAAICAMASRSWDYEWMRVKRTDGRVIAEYRQGGL